MSEGIITIVLKAFIGTFFDALLEAFKDWRAEQAQRDLGRAEQKQADTKAAQQTADEASQISLRPGSPEQAVEDMKNGNF